MKAMFENELNTLSTELSDYYNILASNTGQGLNVYMDQIVTIKKLRECKGKARVSGQEEYKFQYFFVFD